MNSQLQALLEASEKTIVIQKEMINNQKLQISNLTDTNDLLRKENQELTRMYKELSADYDEIVSICREQQTLLNQLLDPSE